MLKLLVVAALAGCVLGSPVERIVGGTKTTIDKYPYQVRLSMKVGPDTGLCGGSIIGPKWILTAGHCTRGVDSITVYVGSTTTRDGVAYPAKRLITHPSYKEGAIIPTPNYDYGLIELQKAITYGTKAQPIALPKQGQQLAAGTAATITGWGSSVISGPSSTTLQVVQLKIFDRQQCKKSYPMFSQQMICAGTDGSAKKGVCQGDSGGPLVSGGKVVGVVSFVFLSACGTPGHGEVYGNVADQRNWIKQVTGI